MKYIANMPQGEKQMKSNKVDKEVLKKNQGKITDLMEQIGEDYDSDEEKDNRKNNLSSKNKINIDFAIQDDYRPAYDSKQKNDFSDNQDIHIEPLEENIDIESDNKPIKQRTIKREKKVVEDSNNSKGNNLRNRSGIKRNIKQNDETDNNNATSRSYQKPNFTRAIKDITMTDNTENNNYSFTSFNKTKYKLPVEKDNSIKIFWYDAIEEMSNNKPNVIFFGKIFEPTSQSYLSISIIIKDIYRTVFILPKPEYEDKLENVYNEFEDLRKKRFNNIKEYQCKQIKKNIVSNYQSIQKRNMVY